MAEAKTKPTTVAVSDFLAAVEPPEKRVDAVQLDELFRRVTGFDPVMWGPTIIGYGSYDYTYASGHAGSAPAVGFSPRKAAHSIYVLPGYDDPPALLGRLGKHRTGQACLYVNRLSDINMDVLADLIRYGLTALGQKWPIRPA